MQPMHHDHNNTTSCSPRRVLQVVRSESQPYSVSTYHSSAPSCRSCCWEQGKAFVTCKLSTCQIQGRKLPFALSLASEMGFLIPKRRTRTKRSRPRRVLGWRTTLNWSPTTLDRRLGPAMATHQQSLRVLPHRRRQYCQDHRGENYLPLIFKSVVKNYASASKLAKLRTRW